MKIYPLSELKVENLGRGWVFRFRSTDPNEELVDLLVRENSDSPSGFTLMTMSGYHAGLDLVNLPADSGSLLTGLSKRWLIQNWTKWVNPHIPIEEVSCFRLVENQLYKID